MKTKNKQSKSVKRGNFEFNNCIICNGINLRKKAKTCCQSCAGKLAWETRLNK